MSSDFDPDWKHGHVTRGGVSARVVCVNAKGDFPIVALIDCGGHEAAHKFRANGMSLDCSDLVNAPAPKRKFVRWLNMYDRRGGHDSKRDADGLAISGRIACVRVEFEEGDGL